MFNSTDAIVACFNKTEISGAFSVTEPCYLQSERTTSFFSRVLRSVAARACI